MSNLLLARMEPADFALLQPDLTVVDLPRRRQLEQRNRPIDWVYFLDSGLASVVVTAGSNQSIEVGIIGREGMTGLPILLGTDRSPHEAFIQADGHGRRIPAEKLCAAMEASPSLRRTLLNYVQAVMTQMEYTALSNGRYRLEERLARWLLMAADRTDGDTVTLTHEFLAIMLGARRPGVTNGLNHFEKRGLIDARRGAIVICDRQALEETANGSYGAPEAEYRRLFGQPD